MPNINDYNIPELEKALNQKKKVQAEKYKEELEKKQVDVICPKCKGAKITTYWNMRVAAGEDSGKETCSLCEGKGHLIAIRRFV